MPSNAVTVGSTTVPRSLRSAMKSRTATESRSSVAAQRRARVVFRAGEEIQVQHVQVLNLVVARAHGLLGSHESRDVAAYAHSVLVSRLGERRDPLRIQRAVELDLHEVAVRVPFDQA